MKREELESLQAEPYLIPFDPIILQFCQKLSEELMKSPYPDFVALGFWLRKAHLEKYAKPFLVPRGLVFHIPPASLDVMLVYSWVVSLLVGNSNIIRVPTGKSERRDELLQIIDKHLPPQIAVRSRFIRYGHEEEITALISSYADARVIWGGNETVQRLRRIPIKPQGKDIAFPDRFSYAAIKASLFLSADVEAQKQQIAHFYNDCYWFDQTACSSPKMIFWVGEDAERASQKFYEMLQQTIVSRGYKVSLGGYSLKLTYMYTEALALDVRKVHEVSNELSVLELGNLDAGLRIHCGQGLFFHVAVDSLDAIRPFVSHSDQTLTYYGFTESELFQFTKAVNGKGITRIVPFGQALTFDPCWDGVDLFAELTQKVVIIS